MLNHLKENLNYTTTENGAITHESSMSGLLDFFAMGGALRSRTEDDIIKLFTKAYYEDFDKAMKLLFYIRDVRGGQGERRTFRTILRHLATNSDARGKNLVARNLHNVAEYGRYDDLFVLFGTPLEKEVIALIKDQLFEDLKTEYPTLLAKWLPSENASSQTTKQLAAKLRSALGLTPKQYRKTLTELRGRINIVETLMSEGRWDEIDYGKLPSKAGLQYRQAFARNDAERYTDFMMPAVQEQTVSVNAGTLYPYEIVSKAMQTSRYDVLEAATLDTYWKNLPDYVGEDNSDTLVMVDVSGSMMGTPMEVAISLGIYFAERNKGVYKDHFMTFASNPAIEQVLGDSIVEKVWNMKAANWGMSTNFTKALRTILDTAISKSLPQSELPSKLLVVSDMEFDMATGRGETQETIVQNMRKAFKAVGYEMPDLVFWNVDSRQNNIPAYNGNVTLVSGFSPTIFQQVIESKTALELMEAVINSPRYDAVRGLA